MNKTWSFNFITTQKKGFQKFIGIFVYPFNNVITPFFSWNFVVAFHTVVFLISLDACYVYNKIMQHGSQKHEQKEQRESRFEILLFERLKN